ncbi:cupin domain-containing protein [Cryptosporangium sp. NPDC051539]|uniref:cupin domain-containing protein n=1 Tax=Cryptosporangium sp. NPDC051539 TaxID=3363962 RepID=UPI0037B8BF0F
MIIVPPAEQAGTAGKRGSQFSGDAFPYLTMSADGVTINTVSFTPGARTFWHSHESGQILQVLAGRGLIQADGEPIQVIRTGDVIWTPPGETHWHGAAPNSFLTHVAISLGTTAWAAAVPDAEYRDPTEQ